MYTYTVNGTAPCPNDAATVTVTVVSAPDAGTPGSGHALRTPTRASTSSLNWAEHRMLGGTWSGPSAVIGGVFDPATMNAGVYTYTITVPPPCVNASSTVTITEVAPPNAGTDGAITLCISSPATSLFAALGGAAQAGGSWSGPSTVVGGLFDPATMNAGVYTYTVNGTAPCPNDAATVTVTVVSAPDAGTPGSGHALRTPTQAIDLFTELGGTPDARRHVERAQRCDRWALRSGHDEPGGLHLHHHRSTALRERQQHGHHHRSGTAERGQRWRHHTCASAARPHRSLPRWVEQHRPVEVGADPAP